MQGFNIDIAIEAFARGCAFSRSRAHPYEAARLGPLWVMRDAERKRAADYRREEYVAHGLGAAEVDRLARQNARGHFCICAVRTIDEPDGPIRAGYKAAGYRLGATEAFMVHRLKRVPRMPGPFPIERIVTSELAAVFGNTIGRRPMPEGYLAADSPHRQYVALDDGKPIGWATSISAGESHWVSGMHVLPKYRRRGIGKSILAKMLADDRRRGAKQSVLLASHAGALLYPTVGYEQVGELFVYIPKR